MATTTAVPKQRHQLTPPPSPRTLPIVREYIGQRPRVSSHLARSITRRQYEGR